VLSAREQAHRDDPTTMLGPQDLQEDGEDRLVSSPARLLPRHLVDTDGGMTRVLVVDDHLFFRQTLADLLDAADDLEVVGVCGDGSEVVDAVAALQPDVVLMDVRMKQVSGLEATALLREAGADVRVLIVSSDVTPSTVGTARGNGASGFLFKGSRPDQVVGAVRTVAAGGSVWPGGGPHPGEPARSSSG